MFTLQELLWIALTNLKFYVEYSSRHELDGIYDELLCLRFYNYKHLTNWVSYNIPPYLIYYFKENPTQIYPYVLPMLMLV